MTVSVKNLVFAAITIVVLLVGGFGLHHIYVDHRFVDDARVWAPQANGALNALIKIAQDEGKLPSPKSQQAPKPEKVQP